MTQNIAPEVRARLEKLASYLESLPPRYKHFGMSLFLEGAENEAEANYALRNGGVASCGTVACAVGHGPAAGILFPPEMVTKLGRRGKEWFDVDWDAYAALFTGDDGRMWGWLFSGAWADVDNGHRGAAARIRYVLATGGAPDGFSFPMPGHRKAYAAYRVTSRRAASVDRSGEAGETGTGSTEGESAVPAQQADAQTQHPE